MITSKELAVICNVSRGTVDRALNGKPGINEQTRKRILEASEQYGYRPDITARSLVKKQTMSLGIVIFDLNNTFFAQLLNAMEAKAREKGYFLFITLTNKRVDLEEECLDHLAGRRVDGIILSSVHPTSGYAEFLKKLETPVLALLNKVDDSVPFIGMNDHDAMFDATNYVISKGYQRLIYVSPPLAQEDKTNIYAQSQRRDGFLAAVKAYAGELDSEIIGRKGYVEKLMEYSFSRDCKTAIICSSDYFAINVLNSLRMRGIHVPYDVGVMGFDSISLLKFFDPTLSTVASNIEAMASLAVERVLELIAGREVPRETNMSYQIVPGQSII